MLLKPKLLLFEIGSNSNESYYYIFFYNELNSVPNVTKACMHRL